MRRIRQCNGDLMFIPKSLQIALNLLSSSVSKELRLRMLIISFPLLQVIGKRATDCEETIQRRFYFLCYKICIVWYFMFSTSVFHSKCIVLSLTVRLVWKDISGVMCGSVWSSLCFNCSVVVSDQISCMTWVQNVHLYLYYAFVDERIFM